MSATFVEHFDTCLGCMACETACPSGVRYAPLIEETRAAIERHHQRSLASACSGRLLFARPAVSGAPAAAARCRSPALSVRPTGVRRPAGAAAAAAARPADARAGRAPSGRAEIARAARRPPARGAARRAASPAASSACSSATVNAATARVLAAEGCDVVAPAGQGCCGALALHAGRRTRTRAPSPRQLIAAFEATRRRHDRGQRRRLRLDDEGVRRAAARTTRRGPRGPARSRPRSATSPRCSPARAAAGAAPSAARCASPITTPVTWRTRRASAREPRALLAVDPGRRRSCRSPRARSAAAAPASSTSCSRRWPAALGRRKAEHIADAGADVVVTSNPGCILQIRERCAQAAGQHAPVVHIVELLDASIRVERLTAALLSVASGATACLNGTSDRLQCSPARQTCTDRDLRHDAARRHAGRRHHLLGRRQAAHRRAARRLRRALHRRRLAGLEPQGHRVLRAGEAPHVPPRAAGGVRLDPPQRRRASTTDDQVRLLLDAATPVVTIFGKTWLLHVREVLQTTPEENLAMIADTVRFLKAARQVRRLRRRARVRRLQGRPRVRARDLAGGRARRRRRRHALRHQRRLAAGRDSARSPRYARAQPARHGSASTRTTTSASASPTRWPRSTPARRTSRARSTATASAPATAT